MAQTLFKCPNCGGEMIRDYNNKKKMRTNILVFEGGKCIAKCLKCKENVEVPITLNLNSPPRLRKRNLRHVIIGVDNH